MIVTRYPSNVSPSNTIYGEGTGEDSDNPVICEISLARSGQYVLYIKYVGEDDGNELNILMDVKHASLEEDEWYPILNSTTGNPLVLTYATTGDGETVDYFRIPIVDPSSDLYIAASEGLLRIKMYSGNSDVVARVVLNLLSAIRPVSPPHHIQGGTSPKTGSLTVNISGGSGNATWKIFHDTEELDSGDTRNNLGVGSQLVTITDGVTTYYENYDVSQDEDTEYTYVIT